MGRQEILNNFEKYIKKENNYIWDNPVLFKETNKNEYTDIFLELVDTKKESIQCLSKEETEILRRYLGVYGKTGTIESVSNELDIIPSKVAYELKSMRNKLFKRIMRGCVSIKESIYEGEKFPKDALLIPLRVLDYPYDNYVLTILYRNGYNTVRKVLRLKKENLTNIEHIGEKRAEQFIDYIHSLGLTFKDEQPFDENVISRKKRIQMSEFTKTNDEIKKCEEKIKELNRKKEELIALRDEITNSIQEINHDEHELMTYIKKGY